MAIITSDELPRDVTGAEALISLHKEHRAEIDTRQKDFSRFKQTGQSLIEDGHFLSEEVSTPSPSPRWVTPGGQRHTRAKIVFSGAAGTLLVGLGQK